MVSLKMATSTLRTIDHVGSFDKFILNQPDGQLSKRAQTIKTRMLRKLRGQGSKSKSKSKLEV
ncbi:MAG: hypothetical protein GW917_03270 [Bdellovibrionales bacterium]|nr:hypothetical protein [Bdellovibrionales bacterium]